MSAPSRQGQPPFTPGSVVDYRFLRSDGSVSGIHPMTVVADDGVTLLGWMPVGTPIRRSVLTDGRDIREADLEQRFRLPRKLIDGEWLGTSTLRLVDDRWWSAVWWFFEGSTGSFLGWYVNLEIPLGRDERGVMRTDAVLDIWVDPDRTWSWKDEDEFESAIRAGRFTPDQIVALRAEGLRVAALAESGVFPFDGTHADFAH
ncbi:hypothetical protein ABIB25_002698 [Nakamurella sp. UYEF19]|uniref:DUF402 domain-containing protein n=1 Tax=Nakamurella sp. UYEF19 TaxID=1756392 RepID=UPI00339640B9